MTDERQENADWRRYSNHELISQKCMGHHEHVNSVKSMVVEMKEKRDQDIYASVIIRNAKKQDQIKNKEIEKVELQQWNID